MTPGVQVQPSCFCLGEQPGCISSRGTESGKGVEGYRKRLLGGGGSLGKRQLAKGGKPLLPLNDLTDVDRWEMEESDRAEGCNGGASKFEEFNTVKIIERVKVSQRSPGGSTKLGRCNGFREKECAVLASFTAPCLLQDEFATANVDKGKNMLQLVEGAWDVPAGSPPDNKELSARDAFQVCGQPVNNLIVDDEAIQARLATVFDSPTSEERRAALQDLREFSRISQAARKIMVSRGLLPVLCALLASAQEPVLAPCVFTMFNLVLESEHKILAVEAGVLAPLLHIVESANSAEIREAAIGCICSLSALKANRNALRAAGVIPLLAGLLSQSSARIQKDAVIGLCNLADDSGSRTEVVRTGVVKQLVQLLDDLNCGMENELSILLAILVRGEDGCRAAHTAGAVSVLVGVCEGGSPPAKAMAVSALLSMARTLKTPVLEELWVEGALPALTGISHQSGSSRVKDKAKKLLELMRNTSP